ARYVRRGMPLGLTPVGLTLPRGETGGWPHDPDAPVAHRRLLEGGLAVGEGAARLPRGGAARAGRDRPADRLPLVLGGPAHRRRDHPPPASARPPPRGDQAGARRP